MKNNLITKIALGVALAALVFSIITLIRAIVLGSGVMFAAIQVIGTLIIVSICAIMLYTIRGAEAEEDFAEEHTAKEEPKPEEAVRAFSDEPEENGAEELKNDDFSLEKKYNWSNFE